MPGAHEKLERAEHPAHGGSNKLLGVTKRKENKFQLLKSDCKGSWSLQALFEWGKHPIGLDLHQTYYRWTLFQSVYGDAQRNYEDSSRELGTSRLVP